MSKIVSMRRKILVLLSSLLSLVALAQSDLGMWNGIAFEKELSKKFEFQMEEEIRFADNITRINSLLTELGLTYKANKYYRLGLSYRFTHRPENGTIGNRITLSNEARYKLQDFTFTYRLNVQQDFSTKEPVEYKIRNRLGIDYKINKHWEVSMAGELFYSFYYNRNVLDRYRLKWGVDHRFNKHHSLGFTLIFQEEFNVANPNREVILATKYKYSF